MTKASYSNRFPAPEGGGGGYAGVLPVDSTAGDGVEALQRTMESAARHLLVLRFTLFNMATFALLGAAWARGWIDAVLTADDTGLSLGIFFVFLVGLAICAWRIWEISAELEQAQARRPRAGSRSEGYLVAIVGRDSGSRAIEASRLKLTVSARISPVQHLSNSLVILGLIGTVIGFIIALSGVDPSTAGNVDAITPMVAELIHGMSVALYTTLVGAVLHLWLKINFLMLLGGSVSLIDRLVGRGERDARP